MGKEYAKRWDEKIIEVRKKRELSKLPDSIVGSALDTSNGDIKEARRMLRKYFGIFLTNKIIKGKGTNNELLKTHLSSKKRDYPTLYGKIFKKCDGLYGTLVDFGCGVNGLTFKLLHEYGVSTYLGMEASGQIVDLMNKYFDEEGIGTIADVCHIDLFKIEEVVKQIKKTDKGRIAFLFQIIDAIENIEKNYSKKFIETISPLFEKLVISLPTESLGGRKKFAVKRKWLTDYLEEKMNIEKDFETNGERFIIVRKK